MDDLLQYVFLEILGNLFFRIGRIGLRIMTFGSVRLEKPTRLQMFIVAIFGLLIAFPSALLLHSLVMGARNGVGSGEMIRLGVVLICFGGAFIAYVGIPPLGFSQLPLLLAEYKKAKSQNRKPTLNEQGAYYSNMAYKVGSFFVISGGIILLSGLLFF